MKAHKELDKKRPRRQFTREFKAEIVRLILDGGRSVPEISRDHDLGETSVYHWVKQARLQQENRELKRDRDFFEQATAYFAKGER